MYPLIYINESIQVPSYLFVISLAYCLCLFWLIQRCKKFDFDKTNALDISLAVMIGGLIGARLMHVFYENSGYYLNHLSEIFKVWEGGFVYYGGAIGALFAAFLICKLKNIDFLSYSDLFAPLAPFGYAIGRVGCFLNGCCYGAVCHLPWATSFPSVNSPRHPTQLYAAFIELIILFIILYLEHHRHKNKMIFKWLQPKGQLFLLWLNLHALNRIFMEFFRDDYRGEFIFNLSISTWISLAILAIAGHFFFHTGRKYVFNKG